VDEHHSMEGYVNGLERNGTNIHTDPASRLPTRPTSGKLFDCNLKSDFISGPQPAKAKNSKPSASSSRPDSCINLTNDDSSDELDLFSSQRTEDDDATPRRKKVKNVNKDTSSRERRDRIPKLQPQKTLPELWKRESKANIGRSDDSCKKNEDSKVTSHSSRLLGSAATSKQPVTTNSSQDMESAYKGGGKQLEKFPYIPPLSETSSKDTAKTTTSTFPVSPIAEASNPPTPKEKKSTFPRISPLSSHAPDKPSTFSLSPPPSPSIRKPSSSHCPVDSISPLSNKRNEKAHFHELSDSDDDDDDELAITSDDDLITRGKGNLRPFPMSTQMLEGISPEGSSRKRLSEGGDGRERKKRREGGNLDVYISLHGLLVDMLMAFIGTCIWSHWTLMITKRRTNLVCPILR
jgi:hypothetical protein